MTLGTRPKYYDNLLGMTILMAFLLPHTMTMLLLVNPIMCLWLKWKSDTSFKLGTAQILVILSIIIAFFLNATTTNVHSKSILSALTILMYMLCFPIVGDVKMKNGFLYVCLIAILFSQLIYIFRIPFFTSLIDSIYPTGEIYMNQIRTIQYHATVDDIINYRMGGLYRNPNQCARSVSFLLSLFICVNYHEKFKSNLRFLILAVVSILLSGSRTGFVIMVLILFFYLLKLKYISGFWKFLAVLAIIVLGITIWVESDFFFRGFDVRSGFKNSANLKWDTFVYYINNENSLIRLFFGHFDDSTFSGGGIVMNSFDSEYGLFTYEFGIFGFMAVMLFYYNIYRRTAYEFRLFFWNLLWMTSSTIQSSFRSSLIFMLFLSILFMRYKRITSSN